MKKATFTAVMTSITCICMPASFAQPKIPPQATSGPLPSACPTISDMNGMLNMASRANVVLKLREDSKKTSDAACEQATKAVEGGLVELLTAVVSQDVQRVCEAYKQPDAQKAIIITFLVAYPYNSQPCQATK
ncbi:MAG: hypothetical protein AAGI14_13435 [Pseudomonadota bacterium]